jgi:macrolide-specific efflux system membrane fusion protein
MKNNKITAVLIAAVLVILTGCSKKQSNVITEYKAVTGSIKKFVTTTGTVTPQNRLAVNPPLAGRLEKVLVKEGQYVRAGQTLAYMSSSDRAAIIDAARAQGEKNMKEWEDTYKEIPLIAPISGEVIVQSLQPGQTLATSDSVVVISDRLIVKAQVDETDIGKIKLGQKAEITLDAYSDQTIQGKVDHIYYESTVSNNVTMYYVDVLPEKVPAFFRSGMSANINIIQESKDHIIVLPLSVIKTTGGRSIVLVKSSVEGKFTQKEVVTGMTDDDNVEIVSGLNENDSVYVSKLGYTKQTANDASSPFMPKRFGSTTKTPKTGIGKSSNAGGPPGM